MLLGVVIARRIDKVAAVGVGAINVLVGFGIGEEIVALDVEDLAKILAAVELIGIGERMAQFVPHRVGHFFRGVLKIARLMVEFAEHVIVIIKAKRDAGGASHRAIACG